MPYSYAKLRGRIIEKYGSQEKFAVDVGLSNNSVSKKMTGKSGFSQKDMEKWAGLHDIDTKEYPEYFFT